MRRASLLLPALAPIAALVLSACARNEAANAPAAPPAPQVSVAAAVSRQVTDAEEFTGRFEAVERVEVRPRVSGYISSVNFKDGSEVHKGDVLFVIDPRPYVAERDKARAQLAQARSQLALAKSERERATKLLGQHAISQEEFDTRTAGNEQAQASVAAAQAAPLPQVTVAAAVSRKVTEFDEFTGRFEAVERVEVRPRVSGYISSVNFTDGNEVKKGDVLFVIDPRPYAAERDKARA